MKSFSYNLIIIETSGIGQSGSEIVDLSDHSIYVMTSEYGAASQLEKIDMIDFADLIAINKFERKGSTDALRDVRKQYRRSRKLFDQELISDENLPIYGTIAVKFNDQGINQLYQTLIDNISANDNSFKLKNTNDKIKPLISIKIILSLPIVRDIYPKLQKQFVIIKNGSHPKQLLFENIMHLVNLLRF